MARYPNHTPEMSTVNSRLRTELLNALWEAGRPLTRGELLNVHLRGISKPTTTLAKATLEALADAGLVVRGKQWDEHLQKELDTYTSARGARDK